MKNLKNVSICLIVLFASLLIFGCAKRVGFPVDKITVEEFTKDELSKIMDKNGNISQDALPDIGLTERIIYPGDQMDITIYEKLPVSDEKRLEKKKVDQEGNILLTPIGILSVGGQTVAEAQKEIEKKLSQFVVSPFCEIDVTKSERRVFVFGEVGKAGVQELRPGYTVLDVLSNAGITENAYSWDVKIIRPSADRVKIISVNLKDIFKEGAVHYNISVTNNDIIFVPRRMLKNVTEVLSELQTVSTTVFPWYFFYKSF